MSPLTYCCDGGAAGDVVYDCSTTHWTKIHDAYCGMPMYREIIRCPWNEWAVIASRTNVAMYEDSTMGGLFALASFVGERPALRFYPHADGSYNTNLWVGNDFGVMEDYVCKKEIGKLFWSNMQNSAFEDLSINSEISSCGLVNVFD